MFWLNWFTNAQTVHKKSLAYALFRIYDPRPCFINASSRNDRRWVSARAVIISLLKSAKQWAPKTGKLNAKRAKLSPLSLRRLKLYIWSNNNGGRRQTAKAHYLKRKWTSKEPGNNAIMPFSAKGETDVSLPWFRQVSELHLQLQFETLLGPLEPFRLLSRILC